MTRKFLLFFSFVLLILIYYFTGNEDKKGKQQPPMVTKIQAKKMGHQINFEKLQLDGKKVIGLTPGKEKEQLKSLQVLNIPSPEWQEGLKKALETQGGNTIKELTIQNIDSFVWIHEGAPLFVESVIVKIKGNENQLVNFRVLVDAQTGKILRSWDQPVIDPIDPRSNFKIKVDPRYHTEN